jgi:hypothetical protein
MSTKKRQQLSIFEKDSSSQLSLELEGQCASWSLKIQKITELLMKNDVSDQNKQMWYKELNYYQELLRASVVKK